MAVHAAKSMQSGLADCAGAARSPHRRGSWPARASLHKDCSDDCWAEESLCTASTAMSRCSGKTQPRTSTGKVTESDAPNSQRQGVRRERVKRCEFVSDSAKAGFPKNRALGALEFRALLE